MSKQQNDKQKDLYASLGYLFHVSASRNRKLRRAFQTEPLANDINAILVALDRVAEEKQVKINFFSRLWKSLKRKSAK